MSAVVFRSLEEARGRFGPCALAIGNFDGVHIGHQALLAHMAKFAGAQGLVPAILTFDPHPTAIVAPERTPEKICSLEARLRLLEAAGAQRILVLPFTVEVAHMAPDEFVRSMLVGALETKAVFVGENFRFGYKQAGTTTTLRALGSALGFITQFFEPIAYRGTVVSSSLVRQCLAEGNVSRAGRLLGRCFSFEGEVVRGQGIGAKQTVPTLNLLPPAGQLVPRGVYVSQTFEPATDRRWISITNAGIRPTFGGEELTIETFLLDPLEGPRPEKIRVELRRFVRAERRFASAEELKQQILRDVSRAQIYWRRMARCTGAASIY